MQSLTRHAVHLLGGQHFTPRQGSIVDHSQVRGIHIEPGAREKALLEEDPALKKFKSHKNSIRRMQRARDILTIVVISGCCYEIYYKTMMKKAEREQRQASSV